MTGSKSLRSAVTGAVPADLAAAAGLSGEMGQRVVSFDWASGPLGPLQNWPVEIRTVVATALVSRFPIVLWIGPDLTLVYNDGYIPMLGEKHPAALGAPGRDVWWEIWDVVGPMLASVVQTGVPTWSDDLMLMLASSGRPEERYFTFTYSPIIASGGQISGVFCAVTETTERVLGERRLQTLNALATGVMEARVADDVVEATVEVCAKHDSDLPFVAVYLRDGNPDHGTLRAATPTVAGLLSRLADDASFWGFTDRADGGTQMVDELTSRLPALTSAFDQAPPQRAALLPLMDPASVSPVGVLVVGLNPHRPFDAQYEGFCRLLADQLSAALTNARSHEFERRRAESLAELDQAKTAFLTNVSHEFRTPLTLMLGPLEDAIVQARGDPELSERLETVHRNSGRLLRLVNSLLDFARIEAGQAAAKLEWIDVGALTAQIASTFSGVCERGGIELNVNCDSVMGELDAEMWETIVLNLMSNAFKFTFEGSITVTAAPAGSESIDVIVADTGTGISDSDLRRLFERFYRAGNARGRSAEGSGIGLALVRNLVELHHGTIRIDSELNVGTTVSIRLPVGRVHDTSSAALAGPVAGDERTGNVYVAEALQWLGGELVEATTELADRPLVLVADDNADMRGHVVKVLRSRWNTVGVADGQAAIEFARRHRPDLLVTDAMMPTLDGFELLAAIRADEELASLPVIMLSARAGVESAGEGLAAGADDYLAKPFSSKDLVNRVSARLEAAARSRQTSERHELIAQRMTALAELSAALASVTSVPDALRALLASPAASLGATSAAVGIVEPAGNVIRLARVGAVPGEFLDRYHVIALDAPVPIAEVIRSEETMLISDTKDLDQRYRAVARDAAPAIRASVIQPLREPDGHVLGALVLSWPEPRQFDPAEVEIAGQLAATMAQVVERIEVSEREHRIATELQERLLDLEIRSTAAVISAVYEPAGELLRVGGDWYTATTLDESGRIGVSVGDVVGHGLAGATVMSQLRSALGASALTSQDPTAVIDLLDSYATGVSGAACATVAYAVIDPQAETVRYTCAGHPYPLLIRPDGTVSYLKEGRRSPLASQPVHAPTATGFSELPIGSLLLLYTDGLIERRGESLDLGLRRLADAAAGCVYLPVGEVGNALLTRMAPVGGYPDDVALVAVRPVGTTRESFVLALRADIANVTPTRHRLRAWLRSCALCPDRAFEYDVLLGVGEALINAIEHGSGLDERRTVWLELFAHDDQISASVSDSGHWTHDSAASRRDSSRGHGLTLIHGLSDDVKTVRTMLGTRVTMTHHVRGATRPEQP